MRTATATAAAVTTSLLGAGLAAVLAGRHAAAAALRPHPDRPLPDGARLTVHAVDGRRILLTRSLASRLPGVYGLRGPGLAGAVGPPLPADPEDPPHTVARELLRVTEGRPAVGDLVTLTAPVHTGDPTTALGLPHRELTIPGELGPLPAWLVPGPRDTWVIAVHGLGADRTQALALVPLLHALRLPVLLPAYRGDLGAPPSPDGLSHLGESEWRDLDAAVRHALREGARRVILLGLSTGATMALRLTENSPLADRVVGLVLDSPVLDWHTTLRALAAADGVPAAVLPLAVRAAEGRAGLRVDRPPAGAPPAALRVPTLITASPDDTLAPWEAGRRLAASRPHLVTWRPVPHAAHAALWNADPEGYEETLRRFLVPLL
ncbi:alpha/beta hydrolase [Streptomyces sp. BI20]|uniref:alpha/beta hydrolase n=1 Tax=Streptomyces sp. BI20 TaxID=3403460 RepID=UPI003C70F01D